MHRVVLIGAFLGAAVAAASLQDSNLPKTVRILPFADAARSSRPAAAVHSIAQGKHMTVNAVLPAGPIAAHYHRHHDELVMIVRGKGRMLLGGKERTVSAGDLVFIPEGTVHDFRPLTKNVVAVSTFSPQFDGKDRVFIEKR